MITACLELLSQRKTFCSWMLLFSRLWLIIFDFHFFFICFSGSLGSQWETIHKHIAIMNIIIWQGKSECSDWFFLGQDLPYGPLPWKWSSAVYFLFLKARKFKTSMARVPYNKLLTNVASSSRTGDYWASS